MSMQLYEEMFQEFEVECWQGQLFLNVRCGSAEVYPDEIDRLCQVLQEMKKKIEDRKE